MVTITEDSSATDIIKAILEKIHAIECTLGFVIHQLGLDKPQEKPCDTIDEVGVSE